MNQLPRRRGGRAGVGRTSMAAGSGASQAVGGVPAMDPYGDGASSVEAAALAGLGSRPPGGHAAALAAAQAAAQGPGAAGQGAHGVFGTGGHGHAAALATAQAGRTWAWRRWPRWPRRAEHRRPWPRRCRCRSAGGRAGSWRRWPRWMPAIPIVPDTWLHTRVKGTMFLNGEEALHQMVSKSILIICIQVFATR